MVDTARAIVGIYLGDGRLFTMGNGGSSCDAAHIAVEFLHPVTAGRPALIAINLVADTAMLTAVGNDVGFAHIFVRQIIAQGGRMAQSPHLDHCLTVQTDSIHRIQETHVAIYHILWGPVHTLLADKRGNLTQESASEVAT